MVRLAAAVLLAAGLSAGGASGLGGEAAAPIVVPDCGGPGPGAGLPGALPWRPAETPPPPAVSAKAAVVVDGDTGRVLYGLNEHERRPPASTTKIMTAILALETVNLDHSLVAEVDSQFMFDSSVMGLRPGVAITVRDLLYGLMLPSGNDAALEIARGVDGEVRAFVERMNQKVAELGLQDTNFRNPHGLDQRRHYSTAYDLAMIARYAMRNDEFRTIAGARWHYLPPPSGDYAIFNGNSLLDVYPGADGVKIGWTDEAGWTFVASAVRDGRRVFVTLLDTQDRDLDASMLFDWAFNNHRWTALGPQADATLRVLERFGLGDSITRSLSACR